jgi:uncharacterized protein with FMN-binding domain
MKRGLLIGVGTLGGLGAVFSITPPQFGSGAGAGGIPASTTSSTASNTAATTQTQSTPVQTQAAAPAPTKSTVSKKKKTTTSTTKSTAATTQNQAAAPAPTQAATSTSSGTSGTFAGATNQTRYGPVQVQITVSNGKITAAKALQYPNGDYRSADISNQAIPYLVSQTLAAQSANISGVGGASYTSYGWYQSLQSALKKAGL